MSSDDSRKVDCNAAKIASLSEELQSPRKLNGSCQVVLEDYPSLAVVVS